MSTVSVHDQVLMPIATPRARRIVHATAKEAVSDKYNDELIRAAAGTPVQCSSRILTYAKANTDF